MSREELEKLIGKIQKKMKQAAADLNFEAAAELRDIFLLYLTAPVRLGNRCFHRIGHVIRIHDHMPFRIPRRAI